VKLGLFGGTFNPVHNGHLFLALEALNVARLDRVVFIPNRIPPHKEQPDVPAEVRFAMLQEAIKEVPEFELSRVELEREGPSYTLHTLESFAPKLKLTFICGADAFQADWYRLDQVLERLDTLLVANRAGFPFEMPEQLRDLPNPLRAKVRLLPFPDISISSSAIRSRIRNGQAVRFLIPEPVYRMLMGAGYYRQPRKTE